MTCDPMLQSHAIEKFHHDISVPFVLTYIVNGAYVGMVQRGCSLRFAAKACQSLGIARNVLRQELEGNKAMQAGVLGLVDHTHSAAAQFLDDAVMRDRLADHGATPCYAGRWGKSTKASELTAFQKAIS